MVAKLFQAIVFAVCICCGLARKEDVVPRFIAYVNCVAGAETVLGWEQSGQSPFTHYLVSFLSFNLNLNRIQTDPGNIWQNGGGSTTNFTLTPSLRALLAQADTNGKNIILSLGGEVGSNTFVQWWRALSSSQMTAQIVDVVNQFEAQNNIRVDGIDVDIELGGWYPYTSEKYQSTRDLINAIPDRFLIGFVPQVGNGLCVAPLASDLANGLNPTQVLGGQCLHSDVSGGWVLARLDDDCKRANGSPKLNWWGIQYYNAATAVCCGGGSSSGQEALSTYQHYKNFANGWPSSGDISNPSNPFNQWQYYPGPFSAFNGTSASRLVLGKPSCRGCAGSNYLPYNDFVSLLGRFNGQLTGRFGGVLFWDLCRIFSAGGPLCVGGVCQPSWGGDVAADPNALERLARIKSVMDNIR